MTTSTTALDQLIQLLIELLGRAGALKDQSIRNIRDWAESGLNGSGGMLILTAPLDADKGVIEAAYRAHAWTLMAKNFA